MRQTYDRLKKEYGRLRLDEANRLKELEKESSRLKRLLVMPNLIKRS